MLAGMAYVLLFLIKLRMMLLLLLLRVKKSRCRRTNKTSGRDRCTAFGTSRFYIRAFRLFQAQWGVHWDRQTKMKPVVHGM